MSPATKRRRVAEGAGILALACSLLACAREAEPEASALPPRPAELLAFPEAEGFGRDAKGGRGGEIMFVTSLDDSGPGTLRECIDADRPRVCVFRVGGVIRFTTERPVIRNPYITIAGQTAPGDGVLVTHAGGPDGRTPIVVKGTHDVVIRHVRVRTDRMGEDRGSNDAFTIENSHHVILDHVSGSWALDENVNGHGENDAITVSWSLFAEGLKRHDKCALLSSDSKAPQKFSFVGNICAHNGDRNPDANFPAGSCVEIVNNVLYNASGEFVEIWESNGGTPVNVVGNTFRAGPDTPPGTPAISLLTLESKGGAQIFADDNAIEDGLPLTDALAEAALVAAPVCPLATRAAPRARAFDQVMKLAGALPRDSFDRRIAAEIVRRAGAIVEAPGNLPEIRGGEPARDDDQDGMDDAWEEATKGDAAVADPWGDNDDDGWPNMDEYLDYAHRRLVFEASSSEPG